MSQESTPTQAAEAPAAASISGGENDGARAFRDKDTLAAMSGEPKLRTRRRRKVSYLTINKVYTVDYKDIAVLKRFINERGKILSAKITGNTAKQQRMISNAIRRAREMALLPFTVSEPSQERFTARPRRNPENQEAAAGEE